MMLDAMATQCFLLQIPAEREFWKNMLWFGGLLLAGLAALLIARYVFNSRKSRDQGMGTSFSLDELRLMRDRGEVTVDEYETLRKKMIAATVSSTSKPKEPPRRADDPRRQ